MNQYYFNGSLIFLILLVCLNLLSCSRVGFGGFQSPDGADKLDGTGDAETDDSDPGLACSPWGSDLAFRVPILLDSINSDDMDWKPYVTQDGLSIWFVSDRPGGVGGYDFYRATRTSTAESFGDVQVLSSINTEWQEYRLVFDSVGQTAFISTDRPGGLGGSDLWWASLESPYNVEAAIFSPMPNVNSEGQEWDVNLTLDDLQLFFNRDNQIYFAVRDSVQSEFQEPQPLGDNINDSGGGNPSLTADGLVLVFNATREGGVGDVDIWYATRSDPSQPFSTPRLVPDVNTVEFEADPFVSPDGCSLYFARGPRYQYSLYVVHVVR
jgi:hypothetical protein